MPCKPLLATSAICTCYENNSTKRLLNSTIAADRQYGFSFDPDL